MDEKGFESWAIVELFGHQQIAGMVTEAEIGGGSFIRVDVPEIVKPDRVQAPCTKYFGPSSIYAIHPCSEEIATQAAQSIERYKAPVPVVVPAFQPPQEPAPVMLGPGDPYDDGQPDWDDRL